MALWSRKAKVDLDEAGAFSARPNERHARFLEHRRAGRGEVRVLQASAALLDMTDRRETRRLRALRQSWQESSWDFYDSIGEISYAHQFLANCAARMRIFPAAYPDDGYDENPLALEAIAGIPPEVVAAANDAMNDLGVGRLAMAQLMGTLSGQLSVAGEGYMLGLRNPETGADEFSIRSIDEVLIYEDAYKLRETPTDPNGAIQGILLDPETTFLARLWTPHPRFRLLARSPMKAILDVCEEMQILNRVIRATGRSRIAQTGLLLVPDEISFDGPTEDNDDPEADPFMSAFGTMMMEPIADEGSASGVVPPVLRGPKDALEQIRQVELKRSLDPVMAAQRGELIGRMATGLDLPKEVLMGMADLNHWTAWQVDDSTFKYHVERHIINVVDALTVGYFRAALMIDPRLSGPNAVWLDRLCVWYDPTELLTHPDQTQDAIVAHERLVISDEALRRIAGFAETDAPSAAEIELRMVRNTRTFPPNVLEALFHLLDPTLQIPPMNTGSIPGMGPKGSIPAPVPGVPAAPLLDAPTGPTGGPTAPAPSPPSPAPPSPTGPPLGGPPAIAASGKPVPTAEQVRLSRRLVDLDRDLRARLQVASSASVRRTLEKAGAKLRTKVADAKDKTAMATISGVPAERVAVTLGAETVARYASAADLVRSDWSDVRAVYEAWTAAAQEQALTLAERLGGTALPAPAVAKLRARFASSRAEAWTELSRSLDKLAAGALLAPVAVTAGGAELPAGTSLPSALRPAPPGSSLSIPADLVVSDSSAADTTTAISVDPSTLVPTSTIRAVLAIAGGMPADASPIDPETGEVTEEALSALDAPLGGIGTGQGLADLLSEASMSTPGYQWVHGPAVHPFDPHVDLDGVEFSSFTDDALANGDSFPPVSYFVPGDHDGCTCDFMPLWAASDVGDRPVDQVDDGSTDEDDPSLAASGVPPTTRPDVRQ